LKLLSKIVIIVIFASVSFYNLSDSPDYNNYLLHSTKDYFEGFQDISYLYYAVILICSILQISFINVLWMLNWIPLTIVMANSRISVYFVFIYMILFSWIWHTIQLRQGAILWLIIVIIMSRRRKFLKLILAILAGRFWHKASFLFVYVGRISAFRALFIMNCLLMFTAVTHPLNTFNMFTLMVFLGLSVLVWNRTKIRLTLPILLFGYFIGAYFSPILASRCIELSLLVLLIEIDTSQTRMLMAAPFILCGIYIYYG